MVDDLVLKRVNIEDQRLPQKVQDKSTAPVSSPQREADVTLNQANIEDPQKVQDKSTTPVLPPQREPDVSHNQATIDEGQRLSQKAQSRSMALVSPFQREPYSTVRFGTSI